MTFLLTDMCHGDILSHRDTKEMVMAENAPSRSLDKFMVRLPEGMREQLAASARANRRSMNAELVVHLEAALASATRTASTSN